MKPIIKQGIQNIASSCDKGLLSSDVAFLTPFGQLAKKTGPGKGRTILH
jgi:hypothetical protein